LRVAWKRLEEIQAADPTSENTMTEANICLELQEWLKREDILRKQKSITKWLTSNELNRRFFHLSTVIKRRRNSINSV